MTATIDPLETAHHVGAAYRRYLSSMQPVRDPAIRSALAQQIAGGHLLKGPFLEATPPYVQAASIDELVASGVLAPGIRAFTGPHLPPDRPLYAHQEQAVRKAAWGRNLVVATGTGSGKTESFLLPILNALASEAARGPLTPGVRAILLYPMNALANDQMKRLRALLSGAPEVTFGRYIGETRQRRADAQEEFLARFPGAEPLPNELLSREEMRASPPHLLLTNYAMLEYLLLRPADVELFAGPFADTWRFVVVDEAHVYDGARGAELAMLLRRLRDRVAPERELQYIATSATVGDDAAAAVRFATDLFGTPFHWVPGVESAQDLIRPSRLPAPAGSFWGPLPTAAYAELLDASDADARLVAYAASAGFAAPDAATALAHEKRFASLQQLLARGPQDVGSVLAELLADVADASHVLDAMVRLAAAMRHPDGSAVLSARYHLFARATEGAFLCLGTEAPHVSLARHTVCDQCENAMFEFGSCRRCGEVYLAGTEDDGRLRPRRATDPNTVWLALAAGRSGEDEDDATLDDGSGTALSDEESGLCLRCGALHSAPRTRCGRSGCSGVVTATRRLATRRSGTLGGCVTCGARGEHSIRLFETGSDAATAVLTTAVYQSLPPAEGDDADYPGEGRKLLLFNDSRQAAAFFAPYLDRTYQRLQWRRLIVLGLRRARSFDDEPVSVDDLAFHLAKEADRFGFFSRRMTGQGKAREALRWLMAELVSTDDRQSLEGTGMMRLALDLGRGALPAPLMTGLGLTDSEARDVVAELLRGLVRQGVLTMPENVDPRDEIFAPRLGPIYVRSKGPDAKRKVLAWSPASSTNRRIDYLTKIAAATGADSDPAELLAGIFRWLAAQRDGALSSMSDRSLGVVHQVDHSALRISAAAELFRCDRCARLAPTSVRQVCPALGCSGALQAWSPDDEDDDHYRTLYRSMDPVPLHAMEHTAQWRSTVAAEIQHKFIQGEVNVLSCSTTFELGVDVGDLQAVMLRNMPPTTANYVQRAGRAGRRTSSAALVVTYAQRQSHDLSQFARPEQMIAGQVRAPYIPLANERIDRRHAHSVVLAAFFRWAKEQHGLEWSTIGDFVLAGPDGKRAIDLVARYLAPPPQPVVDALGRILPADVAREIGVGTGEWIERLLDLLDAVRVEVATDVEFFTDLERVAGAERNYTLARRCQEVVKTLAGRNLLGMLATRNVLPKYGFPVDSVELRTQYLQDQKLRSQLELSRDLSSAIYEYAPGAEIVAGGKLLRSAGIYRLPGRELPSKYYDECTVCGAYRESLAPLDPVCDLCGTHRRGKPRQYLVPEFGFIADRATTSTSDSPPRRSWHGATYIVDQSPESTERIVDLPSGDKATVFSGPRGTLVVVADGVRGAGWLLCRRCGWGTPQGIGKLPRSHPDLRRSDQCDGTLELRSLAHRFQTDLLTLDLPGSGQLPVSAWRSALYAILEGASELLRIARDDVDGSLDPRSDGRPDIGLFDTVPGGAGNVLRIGEHIGQVLRIARNRVAECECGAETSCYACLRSYRNRRYHDELSRRGALSVLEPLVTVG
ncbi:DEAD/DEAH box helicase [Cryptosporangium arvum]|uniref:Helicase family protein with metal-binding cysteine cluster n=1 Tax=Cryptosporangium arvum DSM 44712 TaxID=927661 RepID=A0A010ZTJ4_9ACTN|nr:DEAD/DEAH box helicase [Cryptosporangium arvum]EXG82024.1 helicase family protein with metal-binding cysteine cluster [Cryptosporangium arvum DSM 44712]